MNYTPFAHLTNDEFVTHLAQKSNPTDEEMEAMLRIEALLDEQSDWSDWYGLIASCRANVAAARASVALSRAHGNPQSVMLGEG